MFAKIVVVGGEGGDLSGSVIAPAKASEGKGIRERGVSGGDVSVSLPLAVELAGEADDISSQQSWLGLLVVVSGYAQSDDDGGGYDADEMALFRNPVIFGVSV